MDNNNNLQQESMLRVGTILRGIYHIDSYLSSGGFGNTYVATNIEFNERYAIKEFFMKGVTQRDGGSTVSVSNSINQDSFLQQKEKFKKEARRLRQLNNPHIVKVHDLFEENGTAYYVMDYVDGENLSARLKRTGQPMSEEEVSKILPQILDALQTVHDAGIWHLDLKPANIMVDKAGLVKLIDFGASKQLNTQKGGATTSTAISYTNGFAPREQMEQNYDKFGPWTDLYALGATLYNLLTNQRPPLPTDIDDDMSDDKHLALPMPNVSDKMKQLILWLMKTNRMQRPKTIQVVKDFIIYNNIEGNSYVNSQEPVKKVSETEETKVAEKKVDAAPKPQPAKPKVANEQQKSESSGGGNNGWIWFVLALGFLVGLPIIFGKCNSNRVSVYEEVVDTAVVDTAVVDTAAVDTAWVDAVEADELYSSLNGYQEITYDDGSSYKGYFKNGNQNGLGTYVWTNGDKYEGNWVNGQRTGYGTYSWPEKRRGYMYKYVGNFKNGKMDGKGTAYYVGGTSQSGIWKNDELVSPDLDNVVGQIYDQQKSKGPSPEIYYEQARNQRASNGFKAIELFKKVYSLGYEPYKTRALFQIGVTYYYGLGGVRTDYKEAKSYFSTAAQAGSNEAKFYIGVCYEYGRGCSADKNMAEFWYKSSGYSSTPGYDF